MYTTSQMYPRCSGLKVNSSLWTMTPARTHIPAKKVIKTTIMSLVNTLFQGNQDLKKVFTKFHGRAETLTLGTDFFISWCGPGILSQTIYCPRKFEKNIILLQSVEKKKVPAKKNIHITFRYKIHTNTTPEKQMVCPGG